MCKNGKCQERAGQVRNAVISLGAAAREMAKVAEYPHAVIRASGFISIVMTAPGLYTSPGITVIMEVYPTTNDDEIARKADRYMVESTQRKPPVIQMLEELFGLTPVVEDGLRPALPTSTQIA